MDDDSCLDQKEYSVRYAGSTMGVALSIACRLGTAVIDSKGGMADG